MPTATMNELVSARHKQTGKWEEKAILPVISLCSELNVGRKPYTGVDFMDRTDSSQNELGVTAGFKGNAFVVSLWPQRWINVAPRDETKISFEFARDSNPQSDPVKVTAYKGDRIQGSAILEQTTEADRKKLRKQVAQYVADLGL